MILAPSASMIVRPVYRADFAVDRPNLFHGHKGFNWRRLQDRLVEDFVLKSVHFSPFGALRGLFNSQVWFVCGPR